jgi:hypothetical protein
LGTSIVSLLAPYALHRTLPRLDTQTESGGQKAPRFAVNPVSLHP